MLLSQSKIRRRAAAGFGWPGFLRCNLIELMQMFCESIMRSSPIGIGAVLALCLTLQAAAQENLRHGQPAPDSRTSPETLTGKERLGRKWNDEQRIDNCNVPLDKRGAKPRPSICSNTPMG